MTYRIEVERRAGKALARLPKKARLRIAAAIDSLGENPRPVSCLPVHAAPQGTYRVRVGNYRIICVILDEEKVVIVARISRRGERTYRRLG